jgi:peptidyl-prolyl cis-trans isomerase SurA
MNLRDDYSKISQAALEEKKAQALEKWLNTRIATHYVMIDPTVADCEELSKWKGAAKLASN